MQLSARQQKILVWVGYPALAFTAFLFGLSYTFPYDLLKGRIEALLSDKYQVSIVDVGSKVLPGGVVLEGVSWTFPSDDPDVPSASLYFEEIDIDVGLLALLGGKLNVEVVAESGPGMIEVEAGYNMKTRDLVATAHTESFPLAGLPLREATNLPMSGDLNLDLDISLPGMKWKKADGEIRFQCMGCTIGDGVSRIKPRLTASQEKKLKRQGRYEKQLEKMKALSGDGFVVPRLSLGAAVGLIEIKKGVGTIKTFEAVSLDGELRIDGTINFADPVGQSTLPGCMRFKLTEDFKQREKDFGNIEFMFANKKGDDGFFEFPMTGQIRRLGFKSKRKCKKGGEGLTGRDVRPKITTRKNKHRPTPDIDRIKAKAAKAAKSAKASVSDRDGDSPETAADRRRKRREERRKKRMDRKSKRLFDRDRTDDVNPDDESDDDDEDDDDDRDDDRGDDEGDDGDDDRDSDSNSASDRSDSDYDG